MQGSLPSDARHLQERAERGKRSVGARRGAKSKGGRGGEWTNIVRVVVGASVRRPTHTAIVDGDGLLLLVNDSLRGFLHNGHLVTRAKGWRRENQSDSACRKCANARAHGGVKRAHLVGVGKAEIEKERESRSGKGGRCGRSTRGRVRTDVRGWVEVGVQGVQGATQPDWAEV